MFNDLGGMLLDTHMSPLTGEGCRRIECGLELFRMLNDLRLTVDALAELMVKSGAEPSIDSSMTEPFVTSPVVASDAAVTSPAPVIAL